jgi:general secretion pathway protein H
MPMWVAGSSRAPTLPAVRGLLEIPTPLTKSPCKGGRSLGRAHAQGFTLLELLVVLAIVAMASAGVAFAVRDTRDAQLEREALRLGALLEAARAQSRASGIAVLWRSTVGGFVFDGLPADALPEGWLSQDTEARDSPVLVLGPEPMIGRQSVLLGSVSEPARTLRLSSDGMRPFAVQLQEP